MGDGKQDVLQWQHQFDQLDYLTGAGVRLNDKEAMALVQEMKDELLSRDIDMEAVLTRRVEVLEDRLTEEREGQVGLRKQLQATVAEIELQKTVIASTCKLLDVVYRLDGSSDLSSVMSFPQDYWAAKSGVASSIRLLNKHQR